MLCSGRLPATLARASAQRPELRAPKLGFQQRMKHILSACVWSLILSLLAACSKDPAPAPVAAVEPSTPQAPAEAAPQAEPAPPPAYEIDLMSLLGAQIKRAEGLPANELRGDFTGDALEDRAYLVASSSFPPNLPPDIQVWQPFPRYAPSARNDVKQGSPVSLILINGGPMFPSATVILHDDAVDGPMATAARQGVRLVKHADLAGTPIAAQAKGDAVVLPGKAGDGFVYWDGTAFRYASPGAGH